MRVHVFGASGFIGGQIAAGFAGDGRFVPVGYSSRACNLLQVQEAESVFFGMSPDDAAVLASASFGVGEEALHNNVLMANTVCHHLRTHPVRHLVFLSTSDVYGAVEEGVTLTEETLPEPNNAYGIGKLAAEHVLRAQMGMLSIPLTVFRLPGVYGPGDKAKSAIGRMVQCVRTNGTINVHGDGEDKRDFVFIEDVVSLCAMAIAEQKTGLFNVATGTSRTIREIAQCILTYLPGAIHFSPAVQNGPARSRSLEFDITKLQQGFDGMEMTDLITGVGRYCASQTQGDV